MTAPRAHDRLIALFTRLEKLSLAKPRLAQNQLSLPQFGLLACVWRQPGSRVNDLADMLGVSKATVSVAITKLEKGGWLRRKPDPEDKRAARLYLSTKGNLLAGQVLKHRRKRVSEFMNGLSKDEQEQLLRLMDKAITNLESKALPNAAGPQRAKLRI
jgi:MarR family transcriptional regulator for hemolysin